MGSGRVLRKKKRQVSERVSGRSETTDRADYVKVEYGTIMERASLKLTGCSGTSRRSGVWRMQRNSQGNRKKSGDGVWKGWQTDVLVRVWRNGGDQV